MQAILKKWKLLIFSGVALAILAYAADPLGELTLKMFQRKNQSIIQVNPHWQCFTNIECGFVVTFPSRPFRHPQTLSSHQNVISYQQFASVLGSNQVFMVATLRTSLTNFYSSEQIQLLMDKSMEGAMGKDDKLIGQRDIMLGTNIGREFEFQKTSGEFVKMRFYQVGHNLQTLTVLQPFTNRDSTNISYFLDSFGLISK